MSSDNNIRESENESLKSSEETCHISGAAHLNSLNNTEKSEIFLNELQPRDWQLMGMEKNDWKRDRMKTEDE